MAPAASRYANQASHAAGSAATTAASVTPAEIVCRTPTADRAAANSSVTARPDSNCVIITSSYIDRRLFISTRTSPSSSTADIRPDEIGQGA